MIVFLFIKRSCEAIQKLSAALFAGGDLPEHGRLAFIEEMEQVFMEARQDYESRLSARCSSEYRPMKYYEMMSDFLKGAMRKSTLN
ncbi:MAG: hypothetical protein LUE19_05675 [Clostridiales bacterium]|nr:hypothetical protein [Clostridiales bacterium]